MPSEFETGVLVGLLLGEGHFGGDGRQPQVTLRMHVKHSRIFDWLERNFPGGRVYGPYEHGGRRYLQWMARGSFLRDELLPILLEHVSADIDEYAHRRLEDMCSRYGRRLGLTPQEGQYTWSEEGIRAAGEPPAGRRTPAAPPGSALVPGASGTPISDAERLSRIEQLFEQLKRGGPEPPT